MSYTFNDGKTVHLSFGKGAGFTVRSIIGFSKIIQWGCMIDLLDGKLIAFAIVMVFPLMFEQSKMA